MLTDDLAIVISLLSVIISVLSIKVSIKTLNEQKEYNRICEMPIPFVFTMNYENEIGMEIKNYGKGVLFIQKIVFKDVKGKESSCLYDLMPKDINWKNYLQTTDNFILAVAPNDKIVFICLSSDNKTEKEKARKALDNISVKLVYTDVYKRQSCYSMDFKGHYIM